MKHVIQLAKITNVNCVTFSNNRYSMGENLVPEIIRIHITSKRLIARARASVYIKIDGNTGHISLNILIIYSEGQF